MQETGLAKTATAHTPFLSFWKPLCALVLKPVHVEFCFQRRSPQLFGARTLFRSWKFYPVLARTSGVVMSILDSGICAAGASQAAAWTPDVGPSCSVVGPLPSSLLNQSLHISGSHATRQSPAISFQAVFCLVFHGHNKRDPSAPPLLRRRPEGAPAEIWQRIESIKKIGAPLLNFSKPHACS